MCGRSVHAEPLTKKDLEIGTSLLAQIDGVAYRGWISRYVRMVDSLLFELSYIALQTR